MKSCRQFPLGETKKEYIFHFDRQRKSCKIYFICLNSFNYDICIFFYRPTQPNLNTELRMSAISKIQSKMKFKMSRKYRMAWSEKGIIGLRHLMIDMFMREHEHDEMRK